MTARAAAGTAVGESVCAGAPTVTVLSRFIFGVGKFRATVGANGQVRLSKKSGSVYDVMDSGPFATGDIQDLWQGLAELGATIK